MRRLLCILICIFGVLLASCGNTGPAPTGDISSNFPYTASEDEPIDYGAGFVDALQYRDGYLYLFITSSGGDRALMRINPKTGNSTSVCSDPLCLGDSPSCPFYGCMWSIPIEGNRFVNMRYFVADELLSQLLLYDSESGKTTLLEDYGMDPVGFSRELYVGDYRFYMGQVYDSEHDLWRYCGMRMDLNTGEVIELPVSEGHSMLFVIDKRIYLSDGATLYSLDLDGNDRIEHGEGIVYSSKTDGEYIYYTDSGELCRRKLDGGEERLGVMPSENQTWELTDKYIYYFAGGSVTAGVADISGWAGDEVVIDSPELRRCAHDGSGDTLVYSFGEAEDGEWLVPTYWKVYGNYVYLTYTWYNDADGDGVFRDNETGNSIGGEAGTVLLRIDVTTGKTYEIAISE